MTEATETEQERPSKAKKPTPITVLVVSDEIAHQKAQRHVRDEKLGDHLKLTQEVRLDRLKSTSLLACMLVQEGKAEIAITVPIRVEKHWHETEDGGYVDVRELCAEITKAVRPAHVTVWRGNPGDGELGRLTLHY